MAITLKNSHCRNYFANQISKSQLHSFPYSEYELSRIADRVFHEADDNSDGQLTFEEFAEATKHVEIEKRMSFLSLGP